MSEKTTIDVIVVEPMRKPKLVSIDDSLESMQNIVGGMIEEYMPFEDDVAIVCNEEGKMNGMSLNREIKDKDGQRMDIIAGPFFIAYAPIESEKFLSLPDDLREKYMHEFRHPESFHMTDKGIKATAVLPNIDDLER